MAHLDNPGIQINQRGKAKRLNEKERTLLKRPQSIDATIGHLKQDHRMDRCPLRGEMGDRIHAVLCAAGYNLQWLLRMIVKKGLGLFLCRLLGCLIALLSAVGWCQSRTIGTLGSRIQLVAT